MNSNHQGNKQGQRVGAKTIYGEDDRRDWFQVTDEEYKSWARSTAALIQKSNLNIQRDSDGYYTITPSRHSREQDLCGGESFGEQPVPSFCSSFLVAPTLIMTAGHCIITEDECRDTYFVFDFAKQIEGQDEYRIPANNIYECKSIVARRFGQGHDYAMIELDRATDRRGLPFRRDQEEVSVGTELILIGHPNGLPSKIVTGGIVRSVNKDRIVASVDAFDGNSGSPAINIRTGVVEGILTKGSDDYRRRIFCNEEYVCNGDNDCPGEVITPMYKIISQNANRLCSI